MDLSLPRRLQLRVQFCADLRAVRAKKICLARPLRSPVGQCILHNSKQTDKVFEILQGYGRQVGSLQLAVKRVYRWQLFCRG